MPRVAYHSSLEAAIAAGPPTAGNLAIPVFAHGSMEAELYCPQGTDPQTPHSRDEIYIVAHGEGQFFNGEWVIDVSPGSFLFVPAGVAHHFLNMSDGFAVWVIFYGPDGGEATAGD
jgi:mannose-6-phosphate isomerase-like protein (cupin superfamily)